MVFHHYCHYEDLRLLPSVCEEIIIQQTLIIRKDSNLEDFIKDIDTDYKSSAEPYVYLLPENGESGHLYIYKFFPESNKIICLCSVLDEAVEDAVPIKINEHLYLFCTPRENPNGNVLHIYKWSYKEK